MGLPRYTAKRDTNEPEIIRAFEALGCKVEQVSAKDIPDLLVSIFGVNTLVEVKYGTGKLEPDQEIFHREWPTHVYVVRCVDDVISLVKNIRNGNG